jgi:hypothetical protein
MAPVGPSSSSASQVYNGVQRNDGSDTNRNAVKAQANRTSAGGSSSFQLPSNATPKGDWVLSENANPQNFEANAPRGSYLNVVV